MTSSDGHVGKLVGKGQREIVVFYGNNLIYFNVVRSSLDSCCCIIAHSIMRT